MNEALIYRKGTPIPPPRGASGSIATPIEKAEVLACRTSSSSIGTLRIVPSLKLKGSFFSKPHTNDLQPIRAKEVADFINKLKPNKAPGLD
ncbi:hypothetical protein AVEN_125246-1 [Araneus ventricosus]|uniref:Uncharacterized protein n=1 Tax=Araneus ventricosus TaxID=182803 RepID=A0A4Y1ZLR4_ARAVE|nr:hypothetical protein AVEN_125246-1 [Araneus ventricosus]